MNGLLGRQLKTNSSFKLNQPSKMISLDGYRFLGFETGVAVKE